MIDTPALDDDMSVLAGIVDMKGVIYRSILEIKVKDTDKGVAALILNYAVEIDKDKDKLRTLGPLLLQAMEALQMSPRARATAVKGGVQVESKPASKTDELRKRREARKHNSEDIHTATS